jgi:methylenetetrahydrofolate dehydrogenase (NADP+)/methenyltetrahydrofolate cyclohydrolase
MAEILDGKKVSEEILAEVRVEIDRLKAGNLMVPGLAVVLVGDDPASRSYVNRKQRACERVGMYSEQHLLPESTSTEELLGKIQSLNQDPAIHGILVQLPLPGHIPEPRILEAVAPEKDVDGFHPVSVGRLSNGDDCFFPCTPAGVIELLRRNHVSMQGKRTLIIGRSTIVGKPLVQLFLREHATVTIAHSRTQNLAEEVGRAEIVCAAIGRPAFVKGEWIAPGAVVVDVGTNVIADPTTPSGTRLVGDVEFAPAAARASFITPVPGGVGPMTIAMLLKNTLRARNSLQK